MRTSQYVAPAAVAAVSAVSARRFFFATSPGSSRASAAITRVPGRARPAKARPPRVRKSRRCMRVSGQRKPRTVVGVPHSVK